LASPTAPGDHADEALLLGDRIAELARSIQAAEAEMMRLIVEFDDMRGWAEAGFGSCAEWLAWRIGIQPGAARERVRTARALAGLPLASAAMASGTLSYSKARSLTRVATPDSEEALLAFAQAGSAANLERMVRAWKALSDREELSLDQLRHRNRRLSIFVDDDGSWVVRARLEPAVGAVLMRAVDAASDALYRVEARNADDVTANDPPTPPQRRADAIGLVAERALSVGLDSAVCGSAPERYQVMLHVEPTTLQEDLESGRSELDGARVPAETSRRIACDAGVVRVTAEPGDPPRVLGVGRRRRTVPPAVRRALIARDRHCRFPGCACRHTDAHHVVHWADGGRTDLKNLVLLCPRHHRAVHEGGMRVCLDREGTVVFFDPRGRPVFDGGRAGKPPGSGRDGAADGPPPRLPPAPPVASAYPGADGVIRSADIPWQLEARAREALDARPP
jgi:5-methylcytosine-specific restriction endonuclease McrA